MSKKFILAMLVSLLNCISCYGCIGSVQNLENNEMTPRYLYKVLSLSDWEKSLNREHVILSKMDEEFIHLATEEQLDGIIRKYWSNASEYVILKLDTKQLPGKLVYEANPGGSNRYYHLYEGSIPVKCVLEIRTQ